MPSGDLHRVYNRNFLGKDHHDVNRVMDLTTPISGPRHRKDVVHSVKFIAMLYAGNPEKIAAAMLHLKLDNSGLTVRKAEPLTRALSHKARYRRRFSKKH